MAKFSAGIPAHTPPAEVQEVSKRMADLRISVSLSDHPRSGGGCFARAATLLATSRVDVHFYALNAGLRQSNDTIAHLQEICETFGPNRIVAYFGTGAPHEWDEGEWERRPSLQTRYRRLENLVGQVHSWLPDLQIGIASNRADARAIASDTHSWWAVRHSGLNADPLRNFEGFDCIGCVGVSVLIRQIALTEKADAARSVIRRINRLPEGEQLQPPYFHIGTPEEIVAGMHQFEATIGRPVEWVAGESRRDWDRIAFLANYGQPTNSC